MRIIIYNPNSFGGSFQYIKELCNYLKQNDKVESVTLVLPKNADYDKEYVKKLLKSDLIKSTNALIKKAYFLYRTFLSPLSFWKWLRHQPPSVVIFNDFDQWSSWFIKYFFRLLSTKHKYGVILHDPDRDRYTSFLWLSRYTMKTVMSYMDIAFYHQFLPNRPYYKLAIPFVNIPQGIYYNSTTSIDESFYNNILSQKQGKKIISIVGNIRDEKNYDLIIRSLTNLPDVKLLVVGKSASSVVDTEEYKKTIKELGLENRVIWDERYITDEEFSAAIKASDILCLYYKKTFTSQSAVLNSIAPFKKPVIIADVQSGMSSLAKTFSVGEVIEPENLEVFVATVKKIIHSGNDYTSNWQNYIEYSSWENSSKMIVDSFNKLP